MVSRRKTLVLLGHSNADGWAGTDYLFANYPHFKPRDSYATANAKNYWPGIWVATNALPWPNAANDTEFGSYGVGDVAWLEMTHNLPESQTDPHPHPSPYLYPNIRGAWYPPYYHDADGRAGSGTFHGVEIPLMWHLSHYWVAPQHVGVGLVKSCFSSSLFLRHDIGTLNTAWVDAFALAPSLFGGTPFGWVNSANNDVYAPWWTPADKFDWAPNTGRLYDLWKQKMQGALNASDDPIMDVDTIVLWMGDNDAAFALLGKGRIAEWESECRKFIKQIRQDCADNGWTSKPAEQVKIVWMGVSSLYGDASIQDVMNTALQRIEKDDPYMRYVSTAGYEMNSALGYNDALVASATHFSSNAYVLLAQEILDAIQEMDTQPIDALDEAALLTVSQVKDRVRTYYTRGRSNTDVDDATVLQHINGALQFIVNMVGDQAWWLRQRLTMAIEGSPNVVVDMPKMVHRVLKIEDPHDVRRGLEFEQIGFGNGGRLQIILRERYRGDFVVHFIGHPKDLTKDDQLVPMPPQMIEWLVVEATRRLARSASNVPLQVSLESEAAALRASCMRNIGAQQRARRDRMHTQWRMPNLRYRRGLGYWDRI